MKKKQIKLISYIIGMIILLVLGLIGIKYDKIYNESNNQINNEIINKVIDEIQNVELNENEDLLQIHFFDVGQADSILLTNKNKTMLIDAGKNSDGDLVVNNIKALGITKIDYLIGTHPHEDHIGGLDNVINNFDIGIIYMPKVQTNTKTFEDVLDAISNKGLKVSSPDIGTKFEIGNIQCEIMLCGNESKEDNLNLSSIVIRAVYNKQSYLFMGDSEIENENSRDWENTNVLKVGHHGSDTSSSEKFLEKIKPQIAIISVGKDNKYGHPKKVILDRLENIGTLIYRTDEDKNVLITSDGINNKISFY